MGTDIYRYKVLSIDGNVANFEFYSGQSLGLADLNAAFWVGALCDANGAFVYDSVEGLRKANCPLSQHAIFRKPSGDVMIEGESLNSMQDVEKLLKKVNGIIQNKDADSKPLLCGSYGCRGGGQFKAIGNASFNSALEAQAIVDCVNDLEKDKSAPLDVYFKTVRNGPEWISQYDGYPKGTFENFVESVELLEVYYDSLDFDDIDAWKKTGVEENYHNTKAKYKLVMKSPEFLEHVKETEEWDGR